MSKSSKSTVSKKEVVESDSFSDDGGDDMNAIDCSEFIQKNGADNFVIKPIDEKRSSDSQFHSFPEYKYGKKKSDKLILKTGPIKITKGGIPKLDDKWRKTDAKREFMWLGNDDQQPACAELFSAFKSIDQKFDELISYDQDEKIDRNVESKTVVFQKDKKKEPLTVLEYSPLVKLSVQGGDGEAKPDQPEYVPYERCKLKFGKKYEKDRKDGEPSELTTTLFLGDKEDPEDLKYPSDFEKYLRWNCTAQFVLQFGKFRCKKAVEKDKKGKQIPRECAFDVTVLQVIIVEEAPKSGMSNADKYRRRMFPVTKSVAPAVQVETKKVTVKDESSSEESSESESEEETKLPPKKETKAPPKEVKQEKTVTKKEQVAKKIDSESSESSKSSASEEDSEDESSEEKPKPKAKSSKK